MASQKFPANRDASLRAGRFPPGSLRSSSMESNPKPLSPASSPTPSREDRTAAGSHRSRLDSATEILQAMRAALRAAHLFPQNFREIARMKTIANLMPFSIEADVAEGPFLQIRIDPERENPLVRAAELAGARKHATTIDPYREIERVRVFQREIFGRKFCRPIEGGRRRRGKIFRKTFRRQTGEGKAIEARPIGATDHFDGQRAQGRNRIDAARAQEDESGTDALAIFEHVDGAGEIVLDQLTAARPAVDAREHAGIRRAIDHSIDSGNRFEITRGTDVAVN